MLENKSDNSTPKSVSYPEKEGYSVRFEKEATTQDMYRRRLLTDGGCGTMNAPYSEMPGSRFLEKQRV